MSCTKIRYPGRRKAQKTAHRIERRGGAPSYPYQCSHCGGWHLTRQEPKKTHDIPPAPTYRKGKGTRRRARKPAPGQTVEELAQQMREERCTDT